MNRHAYIARAAALQVANAVRNGGHFFCEQLPSMDVSCFLAALADETRDIGAVSLALVGYGLSDIDLKDRLSAIGLPIGHVTTDLHVAARWRNEPVVHSNIIALATGRHPGVSTLAHFPQGNPREFARGLLHWARKPVADLVSTPPQDALLEALADNPTLSLLVSLNGIAEFLATWKDARADDEFAAPRRALPRLGLLPDRNLFDASNAIAGRLSRNFDLTQLIAKMPGSRIDEIRRRLHRAKPTRRNRHLEILDRAENLRRVSGFDAYSALDLTEAIEVFQPGNTTDETDEPTPPPRPEVHDHHAVTEEGGELLVDGDNAQLTALVDRVRQALDDAVEDDEETATGHYDVNGEEQAFEIDVERELMTWLRDFCAPTVWGGFFETPNASFEDALRDYRQYEPILFEPLNAVHSTRRTDLRHRLAPRRHAGRAPKRRHRDYGPVRTLGTHRRRPRGRIEPSRHSRPPTDARGRGQFRAGQRREGSSGALGTLLRQARPVPRRHARDRPRVDATPL